MENEDLYRKANKKVKSKKRFFYHFIVYAFVIGLLYAIMHFGNNGKMLPVIIVALVWGIPIAIHYFKAFGSEHLDFIGVSDNWEEEELEKELDKLKRKRKLKERINEEKNLLGDAESLELKEIEKRLLDNEFD